MRTYWNAFLSIYQKDIEDKNIPLIIVLEAFWYYSTRDSKRSDKLIKKYGEDK